MARIDSFLRLVVEQQASDLHLHAGNVPLIRYQGDLIRLPFRKLTKLETRRFLYEILTPEQQKEFEERQELDFIYTIDGVGRFRANVFVQQHGLGSVFRVIPYRIPTIEELHLPSVVRKMIQYPNGLVLITGPTGSGKSTTLASLVAEMNRTTQRHIITIEDPIEFIHEPINSIITQRQVGEHTKTFADALRAALRESPDVLVIGEMRDLETVSLALTAAETGILILGTLHTNSAAKAINRLIDIIPGESQEQARGILSILLRGVFAQRLCKRADEEGRIALIEVLLNNYAVANMIRENKIHLLDSYLKSINTEETGMQSMDQSIARYVQAEIIDLKEGLKFADDPQHVKALLSQNME